jgi:quercetin dioxygenase-like cupin family protein
LPAHTREEALVRHTAWDDIPREELSSKILRRIVTGEKVMAAIVELKEGALVPMHDHDSEQITYVIEGWLQFTMEDGSTIDVRSGETLVIPSWVKHQAVAMEDTLDLDCFSPIRQDWLDGDDAYLRGGDDD